MEVVIDLVTRFRKAVDKAKLCGEFTQDFRFRNYPRGCCDDVCDLLAEYLIQHCISTTQVSGAYYDGNPENNTSHAWLQIDSTIIDISGDQFKWDAVFLRNSNSIYIGPVNDFYRLFEDIHKYENHDINCLPRLLDLYSRIIKYI